MDLNYKEILMQWIKLDDRYINLDLVKHTSQINTSYYLTLYFIDNTNIKITGHDDIQKLYKFLERKTNDLG
jgi:hypothetical protein